MALQSSSSSSNRFDYDVFLSFRGSDTRYGFTGNLYDALTKRGIRTFMDSEELEGGEEITPTLCKAIENSKIFIPMFSINYAESSFCLDELDHIMSCLDSSKPEEDRLVLPVFYGVEPTHLRHHTGSYRVAIDNHEKKFKLNKEKYIHNMERLEKWKMSLTRVANLSGRPFNPPRNMARNEEANLADHIFDPTGKVFEYKFIGEIVDFVSNKINRTPLHVVNNCVGLKSRVSQVVSLLNMGSNDRVIMVGIHGIGGIGKTTLAREIYNSIANQFKVLCFLENVGQKADQHGLEYLQEKLLHETIREKDIAIGCSSKANAIIKQRLQTMKVLLILDDVDKLQQLKVLAGKHDWFGSGSRVIITTRDKQLLESHGIKRRYEVEELNKHEALELLKWNAFKNNTIHSSYDEILNRVVTYASGLPLALEVVGSNLCGKNPKEWEFLLDMYERIPDKEIQKILQVSFDALEEEEQSVFLNIACYFNGYDLEEVERILCAHHGYSIKYHMRVLAEKSLINVDEHGIVKLHDMIEDMGKEIVRLESPKEPQKRSRLWSCKDIIHVLENNMGTSKIEIIILDCGSTDVVIDWNGEVFKKMRNLKTFIIRYDYVGHCNFSNGPEHFSNSLRVLDWYGYSLQSIPSILLNKKLKDMTLLSFSDCQYLIEIPDISNLPNLEVLFLGNCENLITIHKSVGFMRKLKILEVEDCSRLTSFPPRIKLPSLQKLKISFCWALESFPEILGEMRNITQFEWVETRIKELSSSFQNLVGVCKLVIGGSHQLRLPISILMMPKLSRVEIYACQLQIDNPNSTISSNIKILYLFNCNLSDDVLAIVLKVVANVEELCISENNITILPECIRECRFLTKLDFSICPYLEEIRAFPPNLKFLKAMGCTSLTSSSCKSMLNQELHERGGTHFWFPKGIKGIPEWFEHQSMGNSISFWFRKSVPSIALFFQGCSMNECVWFRLSACLRINGDEYLLIIPRLDRSKCRISSYERLYSYDTHLLDVQLQDNKKLISELGEELLRNEWIHAEIALDPDEKNKASESKVETQIQLFLMQIGIHVFKHKTNMDDIRFTDPYERKRKFDEYLTSSQHFHPEEVLHNNWVMLNCDAVFFPHQSNVAACGAVLRDFLGNVLGGFAGQLGDIHILHAELKAILYGMQYSWNKGYRKVIVESKSISAIQWLRKEFPPEISCSNLVREIHIFASTAGQVIWRHTLCKDNWVAHIRADGLLSNRNLIVF